jgi:hypothetical protein
LEELQNTPLEETSFTARGENKAAGAEAAAAAMVTEDAIATTQKEFCEGPKESRENECSRRMRSWPSDWEQQKEKNREFILFYFK